jgi:hypothetical protein
MLPRFTLPRNLLLLLFAVLISQSLTAYAADEDDYDDYDTNARVARISLLKGEVSLRRAGNQNWERARLNLPLVEGDTLSTERDARVEIQIDARNFVRVGGDSVLRVVTLRAEGVALSLSEGVATVRLASFDKDKEYFEVDAPRTTIAAEKRGVYRLDVASRGSVRVTVRDGGRARVYSDTSGFTLRDNRTAELVYAGDDTGDWELSSARSFDEWDNWTDERERYLASRLRYEQRDRYYDNDVWGAEELDSYGDWSYVSTYGWVWRPRVTIINNYSDWAPYRYGHWTWCPPYGWTWVGDEPWGWAPYHYGRWVYHDNYWCWAPRGYGYSYHRSWWRPALVAFVYIPTSYGEQVCWYPLTYGQHDPHSRYFQRHNQRGDDRLRPLRSQELTNLQRTNPAYLRAVTALPAREFGTGEGRGRPATMEIARRAVTGEPVRGRLPIAPADANRSVESTGTGRTRLSIARPAPVGPARNGELQERPVGAAARAPGVSLDNELRRTRIYNGRDPRLGSPEAGASGENHDATGTGAVARPARPAVRPPLEQRVGDGDNNDPSPGARPARPTRPDPRDGRGATMESPKRDERIMRPGRPDLRDTNEDTDTEQEQRRARPSRPPVERAPDSSAPREEERSEPRERRSAPVERPRPEPREERPAPVERPAPRYERPEPREERPAPREERPAPRNDPPARQEQPRREAPPPQRSEPAPRQQEAPRERQESPRERPDPPVRKNDNDND